VIRDEIPISRIFKNEDFGYRTITVERPERDVAGKVVLSTKGKGKGKPVPDSALRDSENVPLSEDVRNYFSREVLAFQEAQRRQGRRSAKLTASDIAGCVQRPPDASKQTYSNRMFTRPTIGFYHDPNLFPAAKPPDGVFGSHS